MKVIVLSRVYEDNNGLITPFNPIVYRSYDDAVADMNDFINSDVETGGDTFCNDGGCLDLQQVNFPDGSCMVYSIATHLTVW